MDTDKDIEFLIEYGSWGYACRFILPNGNEITCYGFLTKEEAIHYSKIELKKIADQLQKKAA